VNSYTETSVDKVVELLKEDGFVDATNKLTFTGQIASQLKESHCLIFAKLFEEKVFDELSSVQLVNLFSCFTNLSVSEEMKELRPNTRDKKVVQIVQHIADSYNAYKDKEMVRQINTGFDYTIHYDLLDYVEEWCNANNVESCKLVLQKISEEKHVFLGEFVKSLLKINNISCELEKVCEFIGNTELLGKLREIPNITLKYVVTNQSLYL